MKIRSTCSANAGENSGDRSTCSAWPRTDCPISVEKYSVGLPAAWRSPASLLALSIGKELSVVMLCNIDHLGVNCGTIRRNAL